MVNTLNTWIIYGIIECNEFNYELFIESIEYWSLCVSSLAKNLVRLYKMTICVIFVVAFESFSVDEVNQWFPYVTFDTKHAKVYNWTPCVTWILWHGKILGPTYA